MLFICQNVNIKLVLDWSNAFGHPLTFMILIYSTTVLYDRAVTYSLYVSNNLCTESFNFCFGDSMFEEILAKK